MGVLDNVYQCVTDLANSGSNWEYYQVIFTSVSSRSSSFQFVAAHDVPLKTNLEMVRILKALNGSINTEIRPFASWRYGVRRVSFSYKMWLFLIVMPSLSVGRSSPHPLSR